MVRPLNDSPYIYGLHDPGGEHLMAQAGARGWILFTEAVGSDPNDRGGRDYSQWANAGYGILVRLNNGYEPGGTIPRADRYGDFARRVAAYVAASPGCHIWIIGNEPNFSVERPEGEVILPAMYARCYTLCRNAIKGLPGRATDQVITAAVAPWNVETTYAGNANGDWVKYQTAVLTALGPAGCDGIAIHAYTHGADPNLIHTSTTMAAPFQNRQYNFRVYQDFLNGIPANMRRLPVYLTEADQNDAWQNSNQGWIQRAYGEIDWWNRLAGTQVIRALILYRWPNVDRWGLEGKTALHEDFRQAMTHKYNWETAMNAKPATQPTTADCVAQPAITDITNQLSRDADGFVKRQRSDIKYVVINHTAVRPEIGAAAVANAQRQRWPGILSQFFITANGLIQRTNPDLEAVSKDQAWIWNGIHIYVAGNFDATTPTDAQLKALAHLVAWLADVYDLKNEAIKGASELIETHSPGLQWLTGERWKDELLDLAADVPNSPLTPTDPLIQELKAEVTRLKAEVAQLTTDKAGLAKQVTTLQGENATLKKRIAELEARIAELTKAQAVAPPAIQNLTAILPKHATARYGTRTLAAIKTIAIHHSAASGAIPPQNVAAYHVSIGWPGIGYHFYITDDGVIYQCHGLETVSYHVGTANPSAVGICVAGRFMDDALPTAKQMASLSQLLAYLLYKLGLSPDQIKGHKELPDTQTACPGSDWLEGKRWKDNVIALVKAEIAS